MRNRRSGKGINIAEMIFSIREKIIFPIFFAALTPLFISPASAGDIDLLIPGVSLGSVSFTEGSSVEYMIVSEAYSVFDTSIVRLSVLESEEGGFLLEIISSPFPEIEEETVAVRLFLKDGISEARTPEAARKFIDRVFLREGQGPFDQQGAEEIDKFDLDKLFIRDWEMKEEKVKGQEKVETPAGSFDCRVSEFFKSETDSVKLGGVDAVRFEEQSSRLMISEKVPFWGVVRSRVERKSYTRLSSASRSGRPPRPKVTVTESILVSFSSASGR
ncbi:MAG: hypothetical protein JW746_06565 [Candidatus Krumholzibacteriota bacterium]|nr:hypothetical protein [Candidatus Krumholzibacteriota bacterium]